jgi:transposase-like protein
MPSGSTTEPISVAVGVPDHSIEDLLAERGITVSHESVRLWCNKFGPKYARSLKRKHRGYGDTFFIDEVFVKINGRQHYLWRAVDQDGEVVDVSLQAHRDGAAVTTRLRSASSNDYCEAMAMSPGRS